MTQVLLPRSGGFTSMCHSSPEHMAQLVDLEERLRTDGLLTSLREKERMLEQTATKLLNAEKNNRVGVPWVSDARKDMLGEEMTAERCEILVLHTGRPHVHAMHEAVLESSGMRPLWPHLLSRLQSQPAGGAWKRMVSGMRLLLHRHLHRPQQCRRHHCWQVPVQISGLPL